MVEQLAVVGGFVCTSRLLLLCPANKACFVTHHAHAVQVHQLACFTRASHCCSRVFYNAPATMNFLNCVVGFCAHGGKEWAWGIILPQPPPRYNDIYVFMKMY